MVGDAVNKMRSSVRILHLEDNESDAKLIKRSLHNSAMETVIERVDSEEEFSRALLSFEPDVVLCDHFVAHFDSRRALRLVRQISPGTPVIIVTGELSPHKTVEAIRDGAEDVVLKANLERLPNVINEAISIRRKLTKLTARQIEVLRLVAEGNRTSDVARMLKLSTKTVERHRSEIMKRLAIHDVVSLVRYAIRVGLITGNT
jgi:DNA-binding NarL/FixJ family response regulator